MKNVLVSRRFEPGVPSYEAEAISSEPSWFLLKNFNYAIKIVKILFLNHSFFPVVSTLDDSISDLEYGNWIGGFENRLSLF